MSNLVGFKASLLTGGVRQNQFSVSLDFPGFVTGAAAASALGQFHVKAASLPASTVAPIPVYYMGRAINVAGEREFQPWTVMVYNENFQVRDALMRWSHGINNISNNTGIIQPAAYQRPITVSQLDRNGTILKTVTMVDAMPVEVGGIELDWEANNVIEMFPVTFYYNYFEETGVNA